LSMSSNPITLQRPCGFQILDQTSPDVSAISVTSL
jgi:hypothetical protein